MAEAVGVVAILLSAISATQHAVSFIKRLKIIDDPKKTVIEASLVAQTARTENWLRDWDIGHSSSNQSKEVALEARIGPKKAVIIKDLLRDIELIRSKVDVAFQKMQPALDAPSGLRTISKRITWMQTYEDLLLLIKALKALNTALYEVAPPAPRYHEIVKVSELRAGQERGPTNSEYDTSIDEDPLETLRRPQTQTSTTPVTSGRDTIAPANLRVRPTSNPVLTLFRECRGGLKDIKAEVTDKKPWELILQKLRIWSSGLFDEANPLDRRLEYIKVNQTANEGLRVALVGVFVDIAVIEGKPINLKFRTTK